MSDRTSHYHVQKFKQGFTKHPASQAGDVHVIRVKGIPVSNSSFTSLL